MTYIPEQRLAQSTFGDTVTTELRPYVTLKGTYGILEECQTFTATGGAVTESGGEFLLTTGTSVGGYGVLWSRRPVVYLPGVGAEARATARFTAGVANSLQAVGFFSSTDGMFFGYNGTSFGIMHRHHGEIEVRTLTVTAGSGGAATVTVTLDGVAYTAAITAGTTVTGGRNLGVYSVGPSGRATISLDDLNLVFIAGDELVITAEVTSGAGSEMTVSLTWNEIH